MNMKLLVGFLLITFIGLTSGYYLPEEQRTKARSITTQCLQETAVDNNILLQMKRGVFAEDQKLKDFLFCFFTMHGFQNAEGALQEDAIRSEFSFEPRALMAFVPCLEETGENGPEIAYKAYRCFRNNLPEDLKLVL